MTKRDFRDLLGAREEAGFSLCVGLDPDLRKMPKMFSSQIAPHSFYGFCRDIVVATAESALAFKPNIAFFEAVGTEGLKALKDLIWFIQSTYPGIPVILDFKRADIGNTNNGYAISAYDIFNADAVTVNPYFGAGAMKPFWERPDKGVIVLCRTSNPEAAEMQDVILQNGEPYYCHVARLISEKWNVNGNCAMVVGATPSCLEPLERVRAIDDEIPILLPGLGTQGGEVEKAFPLAANRQGKRVIGNVSRAVSYASDGDDFAEKAAEAARNFHERFVACRRAIAQKS